MLNSMVCNAFEESLCTVDEIVNFALLTSYLDSTLESVCSFYLRLVMVNFHMLCPSQISRLIFFSYSLTLILAGVKIRFGLKFRK